MTPLDKEKARDLIGRRHPEWAEHQRQWRFLADSYEGGNAYRFADYSDDFIAERPRVGFRPFPYGGPGMVDGLPTSGRGMGFGVDYSQAIDTNLVPHRSEMSPGGWDKYNLRLSRTPVPKLQERAIRRSLSRIYAQEVQRKAESFPDLEDWWDDVDGLGTPIDKWMRKVVAPLVLNLGQLDIGFSHPAIEPGEGAPQTKADDDRIDAGRCVAWYILPQNVLWWRLDRRRRYTEIVYRDIDDCGVSRYCHWDATGWVSYGAEGEVVEQGLHPFGRVPIVRVFDERKLRCLNVGQPRYEAVADLQRAIYNADSELILQDVLQSGAKLAVPEKYLTDDGEFSAGPDEMWPMAEGRDGTYQGPEYIVPPPGAAADLQKHMADWKDEADRDSSLQKPAGATGAGTVAQSGISKAFDNQEANAILSEIAETLADAERAAALLALLVLTDGRSSPEDADKVDIAYPKGFQLDSAEDIAAIMADIQAIMADAGVLVEVEVEAVHRLVLALLPGLSEGRFRELADEVKLAVQSKSARRQEALEGRPPPGQLASSPDDEDEGDDIIVTGSVKSMTPTS